MTFVDDSKFINNFGSYGAAISLLKGGGIYISNSEFSQVYHDELIQKKIDETTDSEELIRLLWKLKDSLYEVIYTSYDNRLDQNQMFDRKVFDETIS